MTIEHGRKDEIVRVPAGFGRDAGKLFKITEWPARRGERWANKAFAALTRGSLRIDESLIGRGMEAIFFVGMQSLLAGQLDAGELQPILDELFECVKIVRDPATGHPTDLVSDDDIEEIKTVYWLRSEVLRITTNFSVFENVLSFLSRIATPRDSGNI